MKGDFSFLKNAKMQGAFIGSFVVLVIIFLTQVSLSHRGIRSNVESIEINRRAIFRAKMLNEMRDMGRKIRHDLGDLLRSKETDPSPDFIATYFESFQRAQYALQKEWRESFDDHLLKELLGELKLANENMGGIVKHAREAFNQRFYGSIVKARREWSSTQESFRVFSERIEQLLERMETMQSEHLKAQSVWLKSLRVFQTVGGIVGVLLLFFVVTYGLVLGQKNKKYRQDLEDTLDTLQTSQEEYKMAVERFELAAQGTSQGIWEWDIPTNEIFFSVRFLELLGFRPDENLKDRQLWLSFIHPEDFGSYCEAVQVHLKEHIPYRIEFRAKNKAGKYVWFEERGQAVWRGDGVPLRMVGFLADISYRKQTELVIEEQHFKIMESLKVASLAEMATGMAEEIQNPMTTIDRRIQQLLQLEHQPSQDSKLVYRFAERILDQTSRIQQILDGFQEMTKDGTEQPMAPVTLEQIVTQTLDYCRGRFKKNNVRLEYENRDPEVEILCRSYQISQVILNMIGFALDGIHKNPKETDKWIRLTCDDTGKEAEIALSHSGNALNETLRHQILLPSNQNIKEMAGSTIALSLSRGIIENHGGKFKIDGDAAHTRFVITLPRKGGRRLKPLKKTA